MRRALHLFGACLALGVAPSSIPAASAAHALAPPAASSSSAPAPSPFLVAASCADVSKPGRVRCRVRLEISLDLARTRPLRWAEVAIVEASEGVTPLRARLGPLDAETHDDAHFAWAFSLAAQHEGAMRLRVRVTAIASGDAEITSTQIVEVRFHVGGG